MPRVLTHTEGNTDALVLVRVWRSGGVHRPWHASREVEIRCRTQEASSVPDRGESMKLTALGHVREDIPDTCVGAGVVYFPSTGQVGQSDLSIYYRGVLSGIVLRGRESRAQGEGPDGST